MPKSAIGTSTGSPFGPSGSDDFAGFEILDERIADELLAFVTDVDVLIRQIVVQVVSADLDHPAAIACGSIGRGTGGIGGGCTGSCGQAVPAGGAAAGGVPAA